MAFSLDDFLTRMGGGQPLTADMSGLGDLLRGPNGGAQQMPIQHKGMFGVNGTLRDIIGGLGDAMLVQAGRNPMYDPARDQEKIGDAFQQYGFGTPEAIQAVAAINPQLAQQMYNQQEMNDVRRVGLDIRRQGVEGRNAHYAEGDRTSAIRSLGGLAAAAKDDASWDSLYEVARKRLERVGMTPDDVGLPKTFNAEAAKNWAKTTANWKEQQAVEQTQQRIDNQADQFDRTLPIKQQVADAGSTRAGAAVTSAGASASRAATAARVAPSTIARNEASAGLSRSKTKGGGAPAPAAGPPPPRFKGDSITSKSGKRMVSPDGKTWKPA